MGVAEVKIPCYKLGVVLADKYLSRFSVYLGFLISPVGYLSKNVPKGSASKMHSKAAFLLSTATVPTALMVHLDLVAVERRVYTVSHRCHMSRCKSATIRATG
jgi:hypothetical protein